MIYYLYLKDGIFNVFETQQDSGIFVLLHERWEYLYDKAVALNKELGLNS